MLLSKQIQSLEIWSQLQTELSNGGYGFVDTVHDCHIPESLSRTLILSCTEPNDIVLILFGGSCSEIGRCKKLNRRYMAAELDLKYYRLILKRLELGGEVPEKYSLFFRK